MRPLLRSRTIIDFRTSSTCDCLNDRLTSAFPVTIPRRSTYATPFEYRITRRIGSLLIPAFSIAAAGIWTGLATLLLPRSWAWAEIEHTNTIRRKVLVLIVLFSFR